MRRMNPSPASIPHRHVRHFLADRSGVAAIEFALVLPILLLLWLGMAELAQISMANAKTTEAAQAVADLVSRYAASGYTDSKGFSDIEGAAATIIGPLPTTAGNPQVHVVSATLNNSGAPTPSWQCSNNGNTLSAASVAALLATAPAVTPQNANLSSVIVVTVSFVYSPTISGGITGPQTFTATAYGTPRTVLTIPSPC